MAPVVFIFIYIFFFGLATDVKWRELRTSFDTPNRLNYDCNSFTALARLAGCDPTISQSTSEIRENTIWRNSHNKWEIKQFLCWVHGIWARWLCRAYRDPRFEFDETWLVFFSLLWNNSQSFFSLSVHISCLNYINSLLQLHCSYKNKPAKGHSIPDQTQFWFMVYYVKLKHNYQKNIIKNRMGDHPVIQKPNRCILMEH